MFIVEEKEKAASTAAVNGESIISQSTRFMQRLKNIANDEDIFIITRFASTGKTLGRGSWEEVETKAAKPRVYREEDAIDQNANVYYTINPRVRFNGNGQGTKSDISRVVAFYADMDVGKIGHKKASPFETNEEALAALDCFPLPASFVIDTGHGVQALWLFKEAVDISPSFTIADYESINRGIQSMIGADTTADISRIFRLPGSWNVKVKDDPKPVTIIRESDMEYTVGDFDFVSRDGTATIPASSPAEYTRKKVDKRKLTGSLKELIESGRDLDNPDKTDRSELIHSAVFRMVSKGFSDDEIYSILTDAAYKISEKILEKESEKERMRYVSLSIRKAREALEEKKREAEAAIGEMEILGHTADLDIVIHFRGSTITLSPNELTGRIIKMLTDLPVGEDATGFVNALLSEARKKGKVDLSEKIARGIHRGEDEGVFIVNGDAVTRVVDGKLEIAKKIIEAGKIIEHERTEWLNGESFREGFGKTTLKNAYEEIRAMVSLFKWKEKWQADYLAAFLMLAPFQSLMSWRPWLYILGARNTGKTTFFDEVIRGLYPELTARLDKTTSYACAQTLSGTGKIPILDEFEKYRHLNDVMEALKISSRGGYFTRGTTSERARRFRLNHMPFLGSIYLAGNDAAQLSRMIVFELIPHNGAGLSSLPSPIARERIGARAIGAMYREWGAIEELARKYSQAPKEYFGEGVDTRQADNFAYARAILSIINEQTNNDFGYVLLPNQASEEITDDGMEILFTILSSRITVEERTSYDNIARREMSIAGAIAANRFVEIQRVGVNVVTHKGEKYFVINAAMVQRHLLRNTDFAGLKVSEPLSRITGALRAKAKLDHTTRDCVFIPFSTLPIEEDDDA